MYPKGYLKTEQPLSQADAEFIKNRWNEAMQKGETVILGKGVQFVSFKEYSPFDPAIVVCGYCGQWAAVQTECKHCGAKII